MRDPDATPGAPAEDDSREARSGPAIVSLEVRDEPAGAPVDDPDAPGSASSPTLDAELLAVVRASTRPTPRRTRIDSRRRWFPDLGAFWRARQLLTLLSRRNITVTYRQTVLGVAWVVIAPLLSAGLFTFVFGRVAHLSSGGTNYFAFSFAGLISWNLFSNTMTGISKSLVSNSALITKIYFPRLVLPLAAIATTLIECAIGLVVMTALLVAYGIGFSVHLVVLPLWLLLALVLAIGPGLILTAVSASYRDVTNLTPAIVPLFMYLTPVAYAPSVVPHHLRLVYELNPVATVVEGCRWSLLRQGHLSAATIGYAIAFALVALVVGLVAFSRLEWSFADVI